MLVEGRSPTAAEAISYFKAQAQGKRPDSFATKKESRSPFTGNWGAGKVPYQARRPLTGGRGAAVIVKWVTPIAADLARAKSKLIRMGQIIPPAKRKTAKTRKMSGRGKKSNIKRITNQLRGHKRQKL